MLISNVVNCAGVSWDNFVLAETPIAADSLAAYAVGLFPPLRGAYSFMAPIMDLFIYLSLNVCPRAFHPADADG